MGMHAGSKHLYPLSSLISLLETRPPVAQTGPELRGSGGRPLPCNPVSTSQALGLQVMNCPSKLTKSTFGQNPGRACACFSPMHIKVPSAICANLAIYKGRLTELPEEQRRARLAFRRGLEGTSKPAESPVPMLRVTGRLLVVGLAASGSGRSTGLEESQLRVRETMGPGLFSDCRKRKAMRVYERCYSQEHMKHSILEFVI